MKGIIPKGKPRGIKPCFPCAHSGMNKFTTAFHSLVGFIPDGDRANPDIESFVRKPVSIFIPATGVCEYSISADHTHPAYSFIIPLNDLGGAVVNGEGELKYHLLFKIR